MEYRIHDHLAYRLSGSVVGAPVMNWGTCTSGCTFARLVSHGPHQVLWADVRNSLPAHTQLVGQLSQCNLCISTIHIDGYWNDVFQPFEYMNFVLFIECGEGPSDTVRVASMEDPLNDTVLRLWAGRMASNSSDLEPQRYANQSWQP